ncbi:MAG: response regulator transcription factor [Flavobacteriales bacterium]|nr:response regulator transcription factor [Flavobacteriales bacterium]
MITCIIVDDEPLAGSLLSSYAEKLGYLTVLKSFTNPIEALSFLQSNTVDLLFLDIQMPELNGIQLAKLVPTHTRIIFTTAYPNYALAGFEVEAMDYLVKPISFEQFVTSSSRIFKTKTVRTEQSKPPTEHIYVKTEYKLQRIDFHSINLLKGLGDYTSIITPTGKILTLENMKSFEERLPSAVFIRVHKSYIIPFKKINYIEKNRIHIGQEVIPIGSTYQENFWKQLNRK